MLELVGIINGTRLLSAREKLTVCDVTNLPIMDINRQSISIYYGSFVTSLTAYYSCAGISSLEGFERHVPVFCRFVDFF